VTDRKATSRVLLETAAEIATRLKAHAILLTAEVRAFDAVSNEWPQLPEVEIIVAGSQVELERAVPEGARATLLRVPELAQSRLGRIKLALILGLSKGILRQGELVVCVTGAQGRGQLDSIIVVEVGRESEVLGVSSEVSLPRAVNPEVFERTLDLAQRIAVEGREGKPLGTTFVLGDPEEVLPYTKQLIINPFRGYPENERNLLDPALEETLKEFAALDGAFLVRGDGVVLTAGTYLRTGLADAELEQGLGARHAAAIGITAATRAAAVVVSSSTGAVRVYMGGRLLVAIERPVPPRTMSAS
jgi:DNA integrity scanning protein DisA with diadenylate cyclase activity